MITLRFFVTQAATCMAVALSLGWIIHDPAWASAKKNIVATVNGWNITEQQLDAQTRASIQHLESRIYQEKRRALDRMIDQHLLDEAAEKAKLSPSEYVKREVADKVAPPSDAECKAYYDAHRAQFSAPFAKVIGQIRMMVYQGRLSEQQYQLLQGLRKKARIKVNLPAPAGGGAAEGKSPVGGSQAKRLLSVPGSGLSPPRSETYK